MIACYLRYVIDPNKVEECEKYAKLWIPLVHKFGGKHLGYFLPHEGASNIAVALFEFSSLASYEEYREKSKSSPACEEAYAYAQTSKCIVSYERSFLRSIH